MKRKPSGTPGVPTSFLCPQELHEQIRSICQSTEQSMREFLTRAAQREVDEMTSSRRIKVLRKQTRPETADIGVPEVDRIDKLIRERFAAMFGAPA